MNISLRLSLPRHSELVGLPLWWYTPTACAIGCAACHPRPRGLTSQGWVAVGRTVADPVVGHGAATEPLRWSLVLGIRGWSVGAVQLPGFAINWWQWLDSGAATPPWLVPCIFWICMSLYIDCHNACGVVLIALWYFISSQEMILYVK